MQLCSLKQLLYHSLQWNEPDSTFIPFCYKSFSTIFNIPSRIPNLAVVGNKIILSNFIIFIGARGQRDTCLDPTKNCPRRMCIKWGIKRRYILLTSIRLCWYRGRQWNLSSKSVSSRSVSSKWSTWSSSSPLSSWWMSSWIFHVSSTNFSPSDTVGSK